MLPQIIKLDFAEIIQRKGKIINILIKTLDSAHTARDANLNITMKTR
jgi:hypothetical protein